MTSNALEVESTCRLASNLVRPGTPCSASDAAISPRLGCPAGPYQFVSSEREGPISAISISFRKRVDNYRHTLYFGVFPQS